MGRERANDSLYGTKVTVASIQTLARSQRRQRFHPDHFGLIVVDEGHHAAAVTYREVLDYFPSAKRLFVTATPKRADDIALESVCETVAYQYGIEPAIDDGWLVPVRQTVVKVEGLDFSRARTVAEDFNQADLERILTEEKPLHSMVASAFDLIGNEQSLWFCASVAHAKATAGVLSRYADAGTVRFLSGETPKEERRDAVDAYKRGRIRHLLNCALFLEGFDAPNTSAIIMGRPTKSLALYMQVLGRGTRPLPGIVDGIEDASARRQAIAMSAKPHMNVIDFAGNAGRHKIIQAADVLGGKHEPPVRQYAKETMEKEGRSVDLEEALARAKDELALLAEEDSLRQKIVAKASYKTYDVDPFVRQYTGQQENQRPQAEPCSDKQAGYICRLAREVGVDSWTFVKAKKLSKRQAQGVISGLQKRGGR
jgi:superfamily II DNA or RNA helicase